MNSLLTSERRWTMFQAQGPLHRMLLIASRAAGPEIFRTVDSAFEHIWKSNDELATAHAKYRSHLIRLIELGFDVPDEWFEIKTTLAVSCEPVAGGDGEECMIGLDRDATADIEAIITRLRTKLLKDEIAERMEGRDNPEDTSEPQAWWLRKEKSAGPGFPEPDGPVDAYKWCFGGIVTKSEMQKQPWLLASYLWEQPQRTATRDEVAKILLDDKAVDKLNLPESGLRGPINVANGWFRNEGSSLRLSQSGDFVRLKDIKKTS